eukprot:TRINITY_DN460_c0_g1_i1.p1 TRINITY_DN460_c0_g1~~TRINITY_DN460_c0_g1_i1.p1  ORF type:complete len:409 (+),score=103.23 TRINITY_DN460_c0_g1_i1:97-1323(+)
MQPLLAVRIKDGIFVGNVTAASDASFLSMNKVTHIVNCVALEVGNTFQSCGIRYLPLPWRDAPGAPLLEISSSEARTLRQLREFIDNCLAQGECVLIHSILGVNRGCVAAAVYFMSKYKWNFDTVVQYLSTVHPYMGIKPYFNKLLRSLSKRVSASSNMNILSAADTADHRTDPEQQLLRNTYLNALGMSHPKNTELRRAVAEADFALLQEKKSEKTTKKLKFTSTLVEEFEPDAEPVSQYDKSATAQPILTKKGTDPPVPAPPQSPARQFGWATAKVTGRASPSPGRASPSKQQKQNNLNLYCFEPSDGFERKAPRAQPRVKVDRGARGEKTNGRRSLRQQLYKELAKGEMLEEAVQGGDGLSLCAIGLDMFDNANRSGPPKRRSTNRVRTRHRSSSISQPPLASTF